MYLYISIFIILALLCFLLYRRKKRMEKKVNSMSYEEKCYLLDSLIHPFGYQYLPCQDIFLSTFDAWQREFGYTYSYDCFAPYFNMVFDCEPVYFNYAGRTWLIELWKGQYGINTGAEIGIYCADRIVPEKERKKEMFHTIPDEEIPHFSMHLIRNSKEATQDIADISMPHWWLAAFRMGCFSYPKELSVDVSICFPERDMMDAFANALSQLGYDSCSFQMCDSQICFTFQTPFSTAPCGFLTKAARCMAQWNNRLLCQLYLMITRSFCCTMDRLLYLYFYLPPVFRRCIYLRKYTKRQKEYTNKCRKHTYNNHRQRRGKP